MKSQLITIFLLCCVTHSAFAIEYGTAGHTGGDIIAVKFDADEIAAFCDFNRQIVTTPTKVLCIYRGFNSSASLKKNGKRTFASLKQVPVPQQVRGKFQRIQYNKK